MKKTFRHAADSRRGALVALFLAGGLGLLPGQARGATADGGALFRAHCASCHGQEGRGNGPVAPMMRKAPPDLTQLTRHNGGLFPEARIRRIVDGREVESHGTREMPVWGDVFKTISDGVADAPTRILAIVRYLQSLQQRDAH
jgi:mono/diheme cytochrome c family protein